MALHPAALAQEIVAKTVEFVKGLSQGQEPEPNDTTSYDNEVKLRLPT
ncbi:MAG: hypothetical protein LBR21_04525 [Propionibacteriaceae bacterium]|nr:hypothetical protein [Propionibacteriaceae bacterium]